MNQRFLYILTMLLMGSAGIATAQNLSEDEHDVTAFVDAHVSEAIDLLEAVVNVNSGTMNHSGVREVGRMFSEQLDSIRFETTWIDLPETNRAGHLFAERTGTQGKRVLLIGHLDTVFELDSPFQKFERIDDTTAVGPGTEDMKGGDVIVLYALKALHSIGALDNTTVIVAFTGDEESTGRPLSVSRASLIEVGKQSDVALGFESMVGSTGTVARRGFTGWTLNVSGTRAHSSGIFSDKDGAGAIFEAARILHGFYADIRGEDNLTFGPGIILGGTRVTYDSELSTGTAFGKSNVIPQTVVVEGDLRAISPEQNAKTKARMEAIVRASLPQTSAEIVFDDSYPPMGPKDSNYELLAMLSDVSEDLGYGPITPLDPIERGAADVSFVADYVPVIDGLGAEGSGGHTVHERIDLRSFRVAIKRAAILIYRLTR